MGLGALAAAAAAAGQQFIDLQPGAAFSCPPCVRARTCVCVCVCECVCARAREHAQNLMVALANPASLTQASPL